MSKQKYSRLVQTYRLDVEDRSDSREFDLSLYSPIGKVFAATGCHSMCFHQNKGFGRQAVADFWNGVVEDIKCGVDVCTVPDCDTCHPIGPADEFPEVGSL